MELDIRDSDHLSLAQLGGPVAPLTPGYLAQQRQAEEESRKAYEAERRREFEQQARVTALHAALQINPSHVSSPDAGEVIDDARAFLAFLSGEA